jgi:polyketide cyclase/dehydrase/lipid transport protein
MQVLIIILIIVVAIVVLFLIAGLVMGKQMAIEKSIVINKPLQQVFDYIKFVKNHDNFSVWAMMDPDMKKEYRGTDGQPGFVFAWDSTKNRNVGAGEQEIKTITEAKSITHELRFLRPMQNVAIANFVFEPASVNSTKLSWGFSCPMKFPMNTMKPMFENMLGKQLQTGLQNLKTVLEK